jgi:hypothetical protein|tara:strand:- start:2417 stop:2668 length:252 start_codon:yes stop_codon:yes gene_type:complete
MSKEERVNIDIYLTCFHQVRRGKTLLVMEILNKGERESGERTNPRAFRGHPEAHTQNVSQFSRCRPGRRHHHDRINAHTLLKQ